MMAAMALDPHIAGLLDLIANAGYPPMHEGTPDVARKAFRAMTVDLVTPEAVVPVGEVSETSVPGAAGDRPARLYRPEGQGPWPTLVYLHGGGFVIGDLDTHDQVCRTLCRDAEVVVLSVDYRLAPEHPFPAGLEDSLAAVRWAAERRAELGGGDLLAVGGDSAGGNLTAVVSQQLPDLVDVQLLVYPATDVLGEYPSRVENAAGYLLELATMEWFFGHYVPAADAGVTEESLALLTDPRLSPIHAPSLEGQPRAVLVTAEFDPLRDEGEAYADALEKAGVEVDRTRYDGLIHGFVDMSPVSPAAKAAVDDLVARFRRAVHG